MCLHVKGWPRDILDAIMCMHVYTFVKDVIWAVR